MKLSNDFSFFGLNTKAIRSYLKEQAKNQRGVRVTRRGDLVYVITSYAAFSFPKSTLPPSLTVWRSSSTGPVVCATLPQPTSCRNCTTL